MKDLSNKPKVKQIRDCTVPTSKSPVSIDKDFSAETERTESRIVGRSGVPISENEGWVETKATGKTQDFS